MLSVELDIVHIKGYSNAAAIFNNGFSENILSRHTKLTDMGHFIASP